ncbi:MAG: ligase [Acidobacteriota bacterium]|nr:ligase [Acidobacteriota bacterium]
MTSNGGFIMDHIGYPSIENTYREEFIESIKSQGKDAGQWVVTEKIHGGQLALYYDGSELKASTRTAFLNPGMDFFNYEKVVDANADKVKEIHRILAAERGDISLIVVYGELFGGDYPHPGVPKVKNTKRLQKGVFYHPDNLFYAFDIRVNGRFLTVDEANRLFEAVGMFYAKPLFRGTFEECLKHPNKFPSKISEWLGLPPLDDNIAEGIVIKPVNPEFLQIGERVILKSKNEKFEERKAIKKHPKKPGGEITSSGEQLLEELLSLVTENRLQNVLSKQGELPSPLPGDYFGPVMKAFSEDIWEEFNKDSQDQYETLEKGEQKRLAKMLNQQAAKLVRTVLFSAS